MAKIQNNIVMHGASGQLGNQIVFRRGKGGQTSISAKPAGGRTFNPAQLAQQEAFRNAIAYAKSAKDEDVYLTKAQGTTLSAFNVAVADWFGKPEVLEIDTTHWTGAAGQIIRVKAQDDTQVVKVRVQIFDVGRNAPALEQGDAVQADGLWWEYTTTATVADLANAQVTAIAYDLPGNDHTLVWENN
jgi:hypothetical protein